jgi:hypothetical protein
MMIAGHADDDPSGDVADELVARAMLRWDGKGSIKTAEERHEAEKRIEARRKQEKPVPQKTDGRRLRATGRTEQFNIKTKPAWAAEVAQLASERGIGKAELLERILAEWKALGGKARG